MEKLDYSVFYALEKAIKTYRQFAQRKITEAGMDITIDQWLILKTLDDQPSITQQELGALVFKDFASVTRIINLLVEKGFLKRGTHATDRRRFELSITKSGRKMIDVLTPIIQSNRATALRGFSRQNLAELQLLLYQMVSNTRSA